MAPYRQSCSSCRGRSSAALHDVERYETEASRHRMAEALARSRADDPTKEPGHNDPSVYLGEADFHAAQARRSEARLGRARSRALASLSAGSCVLCGGTGYILATGTFVRGAKGQPEG